MFDRVRVTRSQTAGQIANPIAVNWSFFDPNNLDFVPLIIRIPSELFFGPTQDCRTLFVEELKKEFYFIADESSIEFWRPKNKLSVDSAEDNWEKFADGTSLKETFKSIRFTDSFSTKLGECAPELLHLVVTAEEYDHKAAEARAEAWRAAKKHANPIAVNWSFFNPENQKFKALIIRIPSELFSGPTQECRTLFMEELKKEFHFITDESCIEFWRPKNPVTPTDTKNTWSAFTDITHFEDFFQEIFLIESFSTKLGGCAPGLIHLVVTAEDYHKAAVKNEAKAEAWKAIKQNANPIAVNWSFFDPNNLDFMPLIIRIPSELFSGPTQDCLELFSSELRRRYRFTADESSIEFWRPKNKLSVDSAEDDWEKFADGTSFKKTFENIQLPDSFSTELGEYAQGLLHLIVTAEEL